MNERLVSNSVCEFSEDEIMMNQWWCDGDELEILMVLYSRFWWIWDCDGEDKSVKAIMEKWDDGLSWEWIWDFFLLYKNLESEEDEEMLINVGLFEYFDECMKMKMKMGHGRRWRNVNKITCWCYTVRYNIPVQSNCFLFLKLIKWLKLKN